MPGHPDRGTVYNPPLNLAAGPQTLEGDEALSFLRSRHGVGDGSDLGRISNQQVFLSALVRKVKSAGVLGNPLALYPLAKAAVTNMQFSDTLTDPTTLVKIGLALKSIDLNRLVFVQYPTVPNPRDPNRVIPDTVNAEAVNLALRTRSTAAADREAGGSRGLGPECSQRLPRSDGCSLGLTVPGDKFQPEPFGARDGDASPDGDRANCRRTNLHQEEPLKVPVRLLPEQLGGVRQPPPGIRAFDRAVELQRHRDRGLASDESRGAHLGAAACGRDPSGRDVSVIGRSDQVRTDALSAATTVAEPPHAVV